MIYVVATGALDILEEIPVAEIMIPDYPLGRTPTFDKIAVLAAEKNIPIRRLSLGDWGAWPGNVEWEVFNPPREAASSSAGKSALVLRIARDENAILMMASSDPEVEDAIFSQPLEPSARILVAADHGSRKSCSTNWLDIVQPDHVILSAGKNNRFGLPSGDVMKRLETAEIPFFRTDRQGDIRIMWGDHDYAIESSRER